MKRKVYTSIEEFKEQNEYLNTNLPISESAAVLGENVIVGKKTVRNRLVCQPMEGCDGTADGRPGEKTVRRYIRFAEGGAGLIWFEATACTEEGRANPRQLWLTEKNIDSFKSIVDTIRETCLKKNGYAPIIIMQNTHSGRYSKPEGKPAPIIAYNNPIFEKDSPIDKECIITDDGIDRVKDMLISTAVLAEKAGFDGVDIKCCHRYLNSELLSAYNREGRYGGSLENRTRLLREAVAGAKASCSSDFIVTSRLNVYDGFEYPYGFGVSRDGGLDFDITEPVWLLKELYSLGVELVDITMGNPYFNPHVNRPFAIGPYSPEEHPLCGVARMLKGTARLKAEVPDMKIVASGLSFLGVAAPNVASAYIENGGFDLAGFGRTSFAYPEFAADIVNDGCMKKDKICICCSKCSEIMRGGDTPGCVIRDPMYTELYKDFKNRT
ncbi:MAG: flavin oxidoreductase/NADH oxidase [Ruminococcaceae bacterium]|nr:flavin oxidoreductase/NADH oxidase [Oscillospiraceae bacterium]